MILLNELEEYRDHFRGCYFKIRNIREDNSEWKTVHADSKEGYSYFFRSVENNGILSTSYRVQGDDYEVDLTYPSLGLINSDTDVRYVSRRPQRQYRKAFRIEGLNASALFCVKQIASQYRKRSRSIPLTRDDRNILTKDIFDNKYYSLDEAYELIEQGNKVAVAITPKFAISLTLYDVDNYTVYYKSSLIGLISKDSKDLQLLSSYSYLENEIRFTLEPNSITIITAEES